MAATPTLSPNMFSQIPVLGQLDLEFNGSVVSGAVSSSAGSALVAGQPVSVENSAGGVPKVLAITSAGQQTNAYIVRNLKDQNFPANACVELAMENTVIWLTSNAAINRWAAVEADVSTPGNVGPALGINPTIGIAYDQATGSGQLIRVLLRLPNPAVSGTGAPKTVQFTATQAQINAGLTLIPGVTGKKILVSDVIAQVTGAFATGTSVELESTNVSPVAVATYAQAQLTNGAVLAPASTGVTLGPGFGGQLGSGDGLQVVKNGSAFTGGTSILFTVTYIQS